MKQRAQHSQCSNIYNGSRQRPAQWKYNISPMALTVVVKINMQRSQHLSGHCITRTSALIPKILPSSVGLPIHIRNVTLAQTVATIFFLAKNSSLESTSEYITNAAIAFYESFKTVITPWTNSNIRISEKTFAFSTPDEL